MSQKDREIEKRRNQKRADRSSTTSPTRYLSDKDLAERWGVSRDTVWRWRREGKIPQPVSLGDNCTRWKLLHIEAWEESRETAA